MLHRTGGRFREKQVPVTARLSKLFHERFGDEIADEVVNWFNALDSDSRSDLREINELNFARFDAKLEQRFAEQDARIDRRFAEIEMKFDKRCSEIEMKFDMRCSEIEAKVDMRCSAIEARLAEAIKDQTRWMFVAWTALLIPLIVLLMRP